MRKTILTISEKALYDNAAAIRAAIDPSIKMLCVIKADAYGHGAVHAARVMQAAGAEAFAVAIVDEAFELRNAGVTLPITILGGGDPVSLRDAAELDAAPAVFLKEHLDTLQVSAREIGRPVKAALKIDSGMSRIGVRSLDDLRDLLSYWKTNCPDVVMDSMFTHFCVADTDPEFTAKQDHHFCEAVEIVRAAGFNPITHAAATSAMLNKSIRHDMFRAGIGLYGTLVPDINVPVRYAQRLTAYPLRIQTIAAGDTVGYGRTFTAERETRVMTVPIGYGDGYPRLLSNKGSMLVCGKRAPIIGRVCMDMTMIDVTDIPEATLQSEIVIMGDQGSDRITPDEIAELTGTIPYEIMLGFASRVTRVWTKD